MSEAPPPRKKKTTTGKKKKPKVVLDQPYHESMGSDEARERARREQEANMLFDSEKNYAIFNIAETVDKIASISYLMRNEIYRYRQLENVSRNLVAKWRECTTTSSKKATTTFTKAGAGLLKKVAAGEVSFSAVWTLPKYNKIAVAIGDHMGWGFFPGVRVYALLHNLNDKYVEKVHDDHGGIYRLKAGLRGSDGHPAVVIYMNEFRKIVRDYIQPLAWMTNPYENPMQCVGVMSRQCGQVPLIDVDLSPYSPCLHDE